MQHHLFCGKKCVIFGITLDAEISIWMQSGFDRFEFSATRPCSLLAIVPILISSYSHKLVIMKTCLETPYILKSGLHTHQTTYS